jgi:hypothetical protein
MKKHEYNIGDVVQMNSMWDNRYGIIINIDDPGDDFPPVYRIIIQGRTNPAWLDREAILGKVP